MSRMNSRNRQKHYGSLVLRDGEQCRICGRRPPEVGLVIDHIDNDNGNNDFGNLQLLCQSDNVRKNPRGKACGKMMSPMRVGGEVLDRPRPASAEFERNLRAEPRFRHWLIARLRAGTACSLREAVDAGAEYAGCSQTTIERYLKKMSSSEGPVDLCKDAAGMVTVYLKESWLHPAWSTRKDRAATDDSPNPKIEEDLSVGSES